MLRWAYVMPIAALVFASCADDASGPGDASTPDDGAMPPMLVPPAAPAAPALDECAAGWTATERSGVSTCAPWPEGVTAADCAPGEALFVGEGCARIGPACGAGRFATELPTDLPSGATLVYVDTEAVGPGDGSEASPFPTLAAGLAAADSGDVVALSKGVHEAPVVRPGAGVTLHGACVEETTVRAPTADAAGGTIVAAFPGIVLRNFRITGPRVGLSSAAGDVHLESLLIEDSEGGGIATEASVTGTRVVVRDVRPTPGSSGGEGLVAVNGGQLDLTSVVLERTQALAVLGLSAESRIILDKVRIADVGGLGRGVELQMGATAELREVAMDTRGAYGFAVDGSHLTLSNAHLRSGTTLELSEGSTLILDGADFHESYSAAIALFGATATVEDVLITETTPDLVGESGFGIYAEESDLVVDRAVVSGSRTVGVYIVGGTASLTDLEVVRTRHHEAHGVFGHGMQVTDGADVTLRRVALRQNEEAGLTVAQRGTHVTAEDLLVEETQSRESDGLHGVGIAVFAEAALEGGRISLRDNRQTGLGVLMGGRAVLTSVEIRGTLERACAATTCAGVGFGSGVVADEGGSVRLTEFAVSDNALCGVRVLRTAGVDLRDGTVSNHPIGANIEDATFDADRLSDQVAYVGNERNLARDTLPPPGLPAELADPQR